MMRFLTLVSLSTLAVAAPALALDAASDRKAGRANFIQSDGNKDGKLSKKEFRKFIDANAKDGIGQAAMVSRFGAYETAFARVDKNKDDVVTGKELAAFQGK